MDAAEITAILVAAFGVIGVVVERWVRRPHSRDRVKIDLEILSLLPDESTSKSTLRKHIDETITRIVEIEGSERRDPTGVAAALTLLTFSAVLLFVSLVKRGSWLWLAVPATFIGVFGVVGFTESVQKRQRDTARRAVEE